MAEQEFSDEDRAAAYDYARRKIAEANAPGVTRLDLDPSEHDEKTAALSVIPPEIADLGELTDLDLQGTQIADLAPLQAMTALQALFLGNTQVADLVPLQAMTRLQTLTLSDTQVADLAPLQSLTGLQTLYLDNTQVTDLAPLHAMTGLQRLYLRNTQVADLSPLQAMTGLQTLYLNNTQVADLSPLQALTGLQKLYLRNTQVADLSPLQAMTKLDVLSLEDTQVADLLPLASRSKLFEGKISGLWFRGTPAEDRDDAHRALAAVTGSQDRAKQVLQYLNGAHPVFRGPPEPYVPKKSSSPPEDDPEQLSEAIDGPFLTLAHTDFGIRDLKVTVMPFDHDSVTDPTESRSHQDMLETLAWAADELRRLAELNQLGQRDASRLRQYIGYTKADQLNARLLQLIARSVRASIEAAKEEGRLQPDDQQIAEDFLLAHSTLIGEFYPEVLSVEARVSAVEVDESVRAGDILTPMQQLGGVLREEEDLVTPDLQQAFENLERTSEDYRDTEDRAPLMTPEDAEAARGAFLNFAKRTGATIGRLYLFVKKRALEITGVGGGAAGMEAQWQVFSTFAARLGEIWQKIAPFFPPLF